MTTATAVLLEIKRIADAAASQASALAPVPAATMAAMAWNSPTETVTRQTWSLAEVCNDGGHGDWAVPRDVQGERT